MRRSLLHSIIAANLMLPAAALIVTLTAAPVFAQQAQLPALKPPPPPPIRPYQPVTVTPPAPFDDASFTAFRKQLADIAAHKDRAALANLVVTQNFFWLQDKDLADKSKSGIDNLAKAIALDAQDGSGWNTVAGAASEPSAMEIPQQKGIFCAPAIPGIDQNAFQALTNATGTELPEWGYPNNGGLDVHAAAQPSSPVIEKVGMVLVHVLPDSGSEPNQPLVLHIATPSGKTGYIDAQTLAPLISDQMCYTKDAGGWKIAGYVGGVSPQ
jgi:hypothetical protein